MRPATSYQPVPQFYQVDTHINANGVFYKFSKFNESSADRTSDSQNVQPTDRQRLGQKSTVTDDLRVQDGNNLSTYPFTSCKDNESMNQAMSSRPLKRPGR
jgi:hypothetical protein